jgi:hypothetical protein
LFAVEALRTWSYKNNVLISVALNWNTKHVLFIITLSGLDPAEPHFSKTDPIVRLDPTDADFVDVIHTDAGPFLSGGLGIFQPVGHVDFYPNGGIEQPGCRGGVLSYMAKESGSFYRGKKLGECTQPYIQCTLILTVQPLAKVMRSTASLFIS